MLPIDTLPKQIPATGLARRLHGRQQDRNQHGDNGDDDQQFNQGESTPSGVGVPNNSNHLAR